MTPLMPKATAVWLIDNTALTFDQVAAFTGLHPLEVRGVADGEVAIGLQIASRKVEHRTQVGDAVQCAEIGEHELRSAGR